MPLGLNATMIEVRLKYSDEGTHATIRRHVRYTDGTGATKPEEVIKVSAEVEAWLILLMDAAKTEDVSDKG